MRPIPLFIFRFGVILLGMTLLMGCPPRRPRADVAHPDLSVKIPSIVRAAEQADHSAVSRLVRNLADSDPAVRFYAIEALYRLTGQRFGYDYFESEPKRREAIGRWQRWLADQPQLPDQ